MRTTPVILHLDLDAFFAAVEQLHKPSLRGKPVVVGGTGRRGVVATASYEARAFGIGSAMPIGQARRLCPNAAYLVPRFAAYQAVSAVVMGLLRELSPLLEQVSVDEAYLDLTPTLYPEPAEPGEITEPGEIGAPVELGTPSVEAMTAVAARLRDRVHEVTGLTASVGVGTSKLVAKIGSELAKPDGLIVVAPGDEAATLAPLPIGRLPWVGPATREVLRKRRITTVGDLAATQLADVVELLGQAHGAALHQYARGVDRRPVVTEREAKSASAEETFPVDLTNPGELDGHLRHLVDRVANRLARDGLFGRTATVKVRHFDFTTLTRSTTLDQPTDSGAAFLAVARHLLATVDTSNGVRLLGFGVSGLSDWAQQDLLASLDTIPETPDTADAEKTADPEKTADADAAPGPAPEADAGATDRREGDEPKGHEPADEQASERGQIPGWVPGQDVWHPAHGPGWVQGSGLGRVTVRFEGPHTPPGRVITLAVTDPDLSPAPPPVW